jgi:hypothetical protein
MPVVTMKNYKLMRKIKSIVGPFFYFLIYYFYCIKNRYIDYFSYKRISKNFPVFSFNSHPGIIGNKCYGNIRAVKNKLGKAFDKKCMIEHGIYFGKFVIENECLIPQITTIYTYSPYRMEAIKEHFPNIDKQIVIVGPYILFAENFHSSKKMAQLKKQYGRILLVFPSHSFPEQPVFFDTESFIAEIEKISSNFDTVFVSLYWLDIKKGFNRMYEKKGYKIVCSGTRSDPYFLNRQRDLIELSDMTMSNALGTHLGYCIALNRPHYLYKQQIQATYNAQQMQRNGFYELIRKEREIFDDFFGEYKEEITEEQKMLVKYYWGL